MAEKNLKIGLCVFDETDKPVSSKILEAHWRKDIENEVKDLFGLEFEREISIMLCEKIREGITEEVVHDLLKGIKNETNLCSSVS